MQLTVDDWTRLYRAGTAHQIFLNGKDVTRDCVFADDEGGVVRFFERLPEGGIQTDGDGNPITVDTHGAVEIRALPADEWQKYFGPGAA
ncbi:MAG: hypothetical protein EHM24_19740 [Acidobacteria bacterium]|nr:MAG: hypothetical protein EHM24_19740 [Acidobacteriota bacterium]